MVQVNFYFWFFFFFSHYYFSTPNQTLKCRKWKMILSLCFIQRQMLFLGMFMYVFVALLPLFTLFVWFMLICFWNYFLFSPSFFFSFSQPVNSPTTHFREKLSCQSALTCFSTCKYCVFMLFCFGAIVYKFKAFNDSFYQTYIYFV